jgi:DNA-binding CsgD family transcriptional regulator
VSHSADAAQQGDSGQAVLNAGQVTPAQLSERQREAARLLADGLSAGAIARRMGISLATVSLHLKAAYRRTGTGNRARLAEWIRRNDPAPASPRRGQQPGREAATAAGEDAR